jgi:hypothetical protein
MKIRLLRFNKKTKLFDAEYQETDSDHKKGQIFSFDPFIEHFEIMIVNTTMILRTLYNYFAISLMNKSELEVFKKKLAITALDSRYKTHLHDGVKLRELNLNRGEAMAINSDYSYDLEGVDA